MKYVDKLRERFRKKPTRRAAMLMLAGFFTCAGMYEEARAFIFSGGVSSAAPPPPGSPITMLGALNLSTINGPATTLTNEICRHGLVFPDNDLTGCPVGTYPEVRVHGGAALANQSCFILQKWASGRIKHAMLSYRIPSLPGTATANDSTVDQGNNTTALFDIVPVSGTPSTTGITLSNLTSYLSTNGDITGSLTDLNGNTYTVSALTGLAGANTPSGYMSAPTYWGKALGSDFCTVFVASMPFTNGGGNRYRVLQAFFYLYVYHVGSTIIDIEARCVRENGCVGISDPASGVKNSNILYEAADWSVNGTPKWSRASITPNATLNVPVGVMGPWMSGGNALPRYQVIQSYSYLTNRLDSFTFDVNSAGRPIAVGGDQVLMPIINFSSQAWVAVNNPGSGYTSPPTITNTGSAQFKSVIHPTNGTVLQIVCISSGTVGTLGSSGGGGSGLTMTAQAGTPTTGAVMIQDAGAICRPQSVTNGNLALNGKQSITISGTTKGYVSYAGITRVNAYSENDNSAVTITVNGVHPDGTTTPVVVTGPAAFCSADLGSWDVITSVAVSGAANNLCVGVGGIPGGTNGLMAYEGTSVRGVTCQNTYTTGNWKLLGGCIPVNSSDVQEIWYNQTPRHYTSFQNQYLIDSRVLPNYCISEMNAGKVASNIAADQAMMDAWGRTNSSTYPDRYDYNTPWYYNPGTGTSWGYALQESISGENAGLGADSVFDLYWLAGGGYSAWNVTRSCANRIFNIRAVLRDETTGYAFNPATYPNLDNSGYIAGNPASSSATCFYGITGDQSIPQSASAGFGATFAWEANDTAHPNTSSGLTYLLTCNFEIFTHIQFEANMRYINLGNALGQGVNRAWGGVSAPTQQRVTAQSGIKGIGKAVIYHPTQVAAGIFAPKSQFKTMVDNGFNNVSTGKGLYNLYVVGPDFNGIMPSQRGNCHMWAAGIGGGAATGYQLHYANLFMLNLMENGELSAEGQAFLEWSSDLPVQYMNNPTQINPRSIAAAEWVMGSDPFRNSPGVPLNGLGDLWSVMDYCFPCQAIAGSPVAISASVAVGLTLSATSGSSVTGTFASPTVYPDMVGAYIAHGTYGVFDFNGTSFQTSSPWMVTCTANHGIPIDGNGYGLIFGPGPLKGNIGLPPAPLQYGRTVYYAKAVTATTYQLFTDQACTNQVQFTTPGVGVCWARGLLQITAVAGAPGTPNTTFTANVICPFPTTSVGNFWTMAILPPSANNTGKINWFPQGNPVGVNAYDLLLRASLACNAAFAGNAAVAKTSWDNALTWGQAESSPIWLGSSLNDFTGQANRVVKYRT